MPNPWSIGRYEVTALIGKGGMGTVYRARDPRDGREVAIKVLRRSEATQNPELLKRFTREFKLARSLNHPNVVTVLDDGEHEGLPFFVMEFVVGETFEAIIKRPEPLPLGSKLRLMEDVCAGLAHAHQAGIVHRDIKPANLMVGPEGAVKVLDFGIARPVDSTMTLHGAVMGTPNYMSPEQARGDAVDAGADIFAVGAVLYELITGKKAFPGEGYEEVRRRILTSSPQRLEDTCPGINPRLVDIVDQALEKSRHLRFANMSDLQQSLAGVRISIAVSEAARRPASGRASVPDVTAVLTPPQNIAMQHERHVAMRLAAAEQAFKSGDYDAVVKSCEQALRLIPSEPKAAALLERASQALKERQRAESLRSAIGAAQAGIDAGDLKAARREVDRALALDSQSAAARALSVTIDKGLADARERSRIEGGLAEASRRFAGRDYAGAIATLEGLEPTTDARVSETLDLLRHAFAAIEEQRRVEAERERERVRAEAVRTGLARARASSEQGDHHTALREIDHVLSQGPDAAEAADARTLQAGIARSLAAKLERERLMAAVNAARRRFAEGAHDAAITVLEGLQPASDPLIVAALEELRRTHSELLERQRAEVERLERLERQRRAARLIDEARTLIEARSFEAAKTQLTAARAIDAAQPEIDILRSRAERGLAEIQQVAEAREADERRQEQLRREAEAQAEAQRQEQLRRQAEARAAAEAQRQQEEHRREAEAKAEAQRQEQRRREAEAAAAAEAQRRQEEQRREAEARRQEQLRREAEAAAEAQRLQEEQQRQAEAAAKAAAAAAAEAQRQEQQRREVEAAAEAQRQQEEQRRKAEAAAEAQRQEQQRREAEASAAAAAEAQRQQEEQRREAEAKAEAQRQEQQRRGSEVAAQRQEKRQRKLEAEVERQEKRRRLAEAEVQRQEQQRRGANAAGQKPEDLERQAALEAQRQHEERMAADARRREVDARIATAAKLAHQLEFRQAITELEAALRVEPDHDGLTSLLARMRDSEQKQARGVKSRVSLGELPLERDQPVAPVRADTSPAGRTGMIAAGAIVILVLAVVALVWSLRSGKPAAPPEPPAAIFTLTVSAEYPFDVVADGKTSTGQSSYALNLPAGSKRSVQLKNAEFFLDRIFVVEGVPNEPQSLQGPALAKITVLLPSGLETCEVFIDDRSVQFAPLTQTVVSGTYDVSIPNCADRTTDPHRRVTVVGGQTAEVKFLKKSR